MCWGPLRGIMIVLDTMFIHLNERLDVIDKRLKEIDKELNDLTEEIINDIEKQPTVTNN